MHKIFTILLIAFTFSVNAQTVDAVWNPAGNPSSDGSWGDAANWTSADVPDGDYKVIFNVEGAADAVLTDARTVTQFVLGDNGPGETLRVADGGELTAGSGIWSAVGYNNTARLVVETGATVNFGQHMWVGLIAGGEGTVEINGGTVNVGAQTGLGWDGGLGFVYVNDGVLNMTGFDPNQSIGDGSLLQIGNGTVSISGDQVGAVDAYVAAGKIAAQGGGQLSVTFDMDAGQTVISASFTQQATTVWNAGANPSSTNLWSEAANWSDGFVPDGNKVVFNVPDAPTATLNTSSSVNQFVLGDNGPGGTLVVADGGDLTASADIWSAIGYNDTARLIVETGGVVNFGQHMWVGLIAGGNGTVELNGGTINVGAQTGLGWDGGVGFVYVNEGILNMTGFNPDQSIGDGSLLQVGNGTVNINGDQVGAVNAYADAGKITAQGGGVLNVTFDSDANLTIITAMVTPQATTVWNAGDNPSSTNLWSEAANWSDGFVPDGNKVVFNVPDAPDATLNTTSSVSQFVLGDNGPGGTLIVADGGDLTTSGDIWSAVGYNDTTRLVVETGGVVNFGQHMWVGLIAGGNGTVDINGGTINVGAQTGLGWDGGVGFVNVNDGVLNMTGFDPNQSIGEGSLLQVGDGTVNIDGDQVAAVEAYVDAGKIAAVAGGVLLVNFDVDANLTVITAATEAQATTVWNPGGNPSSNNLWSEAANWSDNFVPDGNKVVFNVPDAPDATLDVTSSVLQFVLGDNGPGGTLIVANGGGLNTSADIWSAIGYNNTANMVVETGGVVNFGQHMWVGLIAGGNGTVDINGGTINVGAQTGLGWDGGVGFVNVNEGELNMTGFDPNQSIGDGSILDIENGTVTINGDQQGGVNAYVDAGKITAFGGLGIVEVSYDETLGKTIITGSEFNAVGELIIPGKIELQQNFPNPFSEFTTISFVLRESAEIQLSIYNTSGQRVAELINREMATGTHQVNWSASNLPSGTYIVRLKANSRFLARQMTLLK